ncbi:hypothetical protein [Paenibacillus agricola]|uniref:Uncharacterized protein n=1 Tax=Paenibacillus agricola TaxID=2716264 RepID=A0ABX0JGA0_9BACL|nr:hypothetical protein [Paenibacillus agricola]NHN33264.1 hypothetical protein [Paenibacillus agricola]
MMARQQGYKAIVHYYLAKSCWSIHYNSCCYAAEYVIIEGPWQTEVKPLRSSNPRGWVTARSFQTTYFCSEDAKGPVVMELLNQSQDRVINKLKYDKKQMYFNVTQGDGGLLFTPEGAFIMEPA